MHERTTTFQDLRAWQAGMTLVEHAYAFGATLPATERFGLIDQLRRATTSIPSNIAEGYGRSHARDYLRFLGISLGSLREVETLLLIAQRLDLGDADLRETALSSCTTASKLLLALFQGLRRKLEHAT
jgi:four helix bundle protein